MIDTLRIVLADDHEIVRLGLMTLLQDYDWLEIVGEAGSAQETVNLVERLSPNVVVMDIRMPGESGIDACRTISSKYPNTKVIMLTSHFEEKLIFKALEAGASGYVLKKVGNEPLLDALHAVREGNAMLDPQVTKMMVDKIRIQELEKHHDAFRDLSQRELDVLALIALGKTNQEIANKLSLAEKTIGHHVSMILSKLNLTNRIEAAIYAVKNNIENIMDRE